MPAAGGASGRPAADELRAELDLYQALVEYAPDAIVILDLDAGRFVTVNAAAEQLFGMSRAALLRVGPVQVSPPVQPDGRSSQAAAQEHLDRALAGQRPRFEWTHRRADGVEVPCEVRLLQLPSPDRRLVRGSIVDVTERREAETARATAVAEQAARRAAEAGVARLQATVAGLNAVVWERDPATLELSFVNDRAEELLGYPAARWLTEQGLWAGILHPDDREAVLSRVRAEIDSGAVDFTLAYRVRAADGRWVWLQHLGHVARDGSGAARTLHAVLVDITEARRREEAAALLAGAGRALSARGPAVERLSAVAALAVGVLGDRATFWLRGADGRYSPVAAAPPEAAPQVLSLTPVTAPAPLEAAYRAGRPFVIPDVGEDLLRATASGDEAQYASIAALGPRSVLVVPLLTDGRLIGLLTTAARDARWSDADLALAGDLGQRVAAMLATEQVATRQRQLHEVTVALSGAGSVAEAAAELAAGLRRILGATVVGVCRLDPDGVLQLVHHVGYPADRVHRFAAVRLNAPLPFAEAARTGRPVWLPTRQAWADRYPGSSSSLLEETEASVALPLTAGGRVLGTVAASFPEPRLFEADERGFLLSLAGQAAVAFERASLADVRREMADTLQRSLLPTRLPAVDRLTVSARYLPAVTGTAAGGDWYDVVPVAGGCAALVVGDVVGHGAAAAAVMGRLSSALSGLLLAGNPPARALEQLDRFAARVDGAALATVACLLLDPVTGRLRLSSAGHPAPLVAAADGSVTELDGGHGPALGVPDVRTRPEAVTTLPVGASLLVYSDGLVERRDAPLDDRLELLRATAATLRTAPLAALVDGVLAALVDRDGAGDDVAVLTARLRPAPLRTDLPADPTRLTELRHAVAGWARQAALSAEAAGDLQLAVGEAAANAVEHAYRGAAPGRVLVGLDAQPDGGVRVEVTDGGTWRPPASDPGFRGRGLGMIAVLAEDVDVASGPAGTTLRFRLPPTAAAPVLPAPRRPDAAGAPAAMVATEVRGRRCLALTGDLDLAGVSAVGDALLAEAAAGRPITLDLTGLGFVASVGAGLLLEAVQAGGERLEVVLPPHGPVRRSLDLTGLTGLLDARGVSAPQ